MNIEELREYCLSLPKAEENAPWTKTRYQMLVTFTVGDKWFCLADIDKKFIDVKCSPEQILKMQEKYNDAFEAWHMNKHHWLNVRLGSDVSDDEIRRLLKEGYNLIVSIYNHLTIRDRIFSILRKLCKAKCVESIFTTHNYVTEISATNLPPIVVLCGLFS